MGQGIMPSKHAFVESLRVAENHHCRELIQGKHACWDRGPIGIYRQAIVPHCLLCGGVQEGAFGRRLSELGIPRRVSR